MGPPVISFEVPAADMAGRADSDHRRHGGGPEDVGLLAAKAASGSPAQASGPFLFCFQLI